MQTTITATGAAAEPHALSRTHEFRELRLRVPDALPLVDLTELYTGIENMLEADRCPLLHLLGAGASCIPIAMDLAWTGAAILGKRVLVLNCASTGGHLLSMTGAEIRDTRSVNERMPLIDRLVKVAGQEIYLADIVGDTREVNAGRALAQVSDYFDAFCSFLDMAIVVTPPAESDPLAALMARHADANIMVIEADATRRSEAVRAREVLLRSGRPLIGAILNNRHHHLPLWLSRRM